MKLWAYAKWISMNSTSANVSQVEDNSFDKDKRRTHVSKSFRGFLAGNQVDIDGLYTFVYNCML